MARHKPTRTQKTINNINAYIRRVAQTFGQFSEEYEQVTRELHGHGFEMRSNSAGVIQLANTKANRRQHQTIRAIKNRQKPINIMARKYKNLPPPPVDENEPQPRTFTQWYAESMKDFKDIYDEVYHYLFESAGALGVTLEYDARYYMFNTAARMEKWQEVFESGARDFSGVKAFLDDLLEKNTQPDGHSTYTDTRTGEVMTQTNDDYENLMEGWTDIKY